MCGCGVVASVTLFLLVRCTVFVKICMYYQDIKIIIIIIIIIIIQAGSAG